ncbi:glucokinase [Massilia sp. TS11]|uniref:glucokinase n=1 Tax=Massilia sp. TS11 TaxID=2908003 RepID=UPI001EDAC0F5|nr:glucokinase [Massilia sp. TS11]MCG2586769.1 glucokinase [Massilia sp. TS11]
MSALADYPRLLADIGGTNARFALEVAPRQFVAIAVLSCAAHATLGEAIRSYLGSEAVQRLDAGVVRHAALAIANPIDGDEVNMTNHHWSFSVSALKQSLGLESLLVVNDFAALALALPHLADADRCQVGPGNRLPGRPIGLIGPGTGLGVAGLVAAGDRWVALASEGGHATFSAVGEDEARVVRMLEAEYGHVSAERLLSGAGLESLHRCLSGMRRPAAEITSAAIAGTDSTCVHSVDVFCAMLGTVAGNVALTLGATGGMYIGGGIVPRLGQLFFHSPFRARFESKGRLRPYMARIPTYLIIHPFPAFLGVSALLADQLAAPGRI